MNVGLLYLESLATRQRLRADLQPDGRRGHGRDLPHADLAMDPPRARRAGDGRRVTLEMFRQVLAEELEKIRDSVGEEAYAAGKFALAAELMDQLVASDEFIEFLTLPAYELPVLRDRLRIVRYDHTHSTRLIPGETDDDSPRMPLDE